MLGKELKYTGFAAIIGAPNSGKSTFLNNVVKSKVSIVHSESSNYKEQDPRSLYKR
jgi:GTPase Era involved in 16S rRNA processing